PLPQQHLPRPPMVGAFHFEARDSAAKKANASVSFFIRIRPLFFQTVQDVLWPVDESKRVVDNFVNRSRTSLRRPACKPKAFTIEMSPTPGPDCWGSSPTRTKQALLASTD